jgi:hypothetical protein
MVAGCAKMRCCGLRCDAEGKDCWGTHAEKTRMHIIIHQRSQLQLLLFYLGKAPTNPTRLAPGSHDATVDC